MLHPDISGLDAAHSLVGLTLDNGWQVLSKLEKPTHATGGHFSVCYTVKRADGTIAFLKALNLGLALQYPGDTLAMVQTLINAFAYERDAVIKCRTRKLSRIAVALDHGKYQAPGSAFPVFYIVFEMAAGDVRRRITDLHALDVAWSLRVLHHTAAALAQLHGVGIAHQDLKPSNVLLFDAHTTKVGDLGCADDRTTPSPTARFAVAGDRSYAPPELLYGELADEWDTRRLGCDLYLFGSFAVFLFTGVHMTSLLLNNLQPSWRPGICPFEFRVALPYVRDAFGLSVQQIATHLADRLRDTLVPAIRQLCEPDPRLRGCPDRVGSARFSLEPYVSLFNRLAMRAEYGIL